MTFVLVLSVKIQYSELTELVLLCLPRKNHAQIALSQYEKVSGYVVTLVILGFLFNILSNSIKKLYCSKCLFGFRPFKPEIQTCHSGALNP